MAPFTYNNKPLPAAPAAWSNNLTAEKQTAFLLEQIEESTQAQVRQAICAAIPATEEHEDVLRVLHDYGVAYDISDNYWLTRDFTKAHCPRPRQQRAISLVPRGYYGQASSSIMTTSHQPQRQRQGQRTHHLIPGRPFAHSLSPLTLHTQDHGQGQR